MVRVATVAVASMLAGVLALAQQPTFRAGVDLVNVGVTVTDRRGTFITDLSVEDFEILEDGQRQAITYFARGDETVAPQELHVGLLFDTSGSMGEDIKLARSAAVRFLNTLSDAKDMTLVDFDTEVRVARYEQRDFPRIV
jgi:Ca-activated chloride channel family protein